MLNFTHIVSILFRIEERLGEVSKWKKETLMGKHFKLVLARSVSPISSIVKCPYLRRTSRK